ncbi:MAG: glutaredoxin family protein [Arenicella sp.]
MLLKALRNGAGLLIVFLDWLTKPKGVSRSSEQQQIVQDSLQGHSLYQLYACPFCIKTRRALNKLNVSMDIRDIGKNTAYRQELNQGGGRVKVPCLRIEQDNEVRWMYESDDIISYLNQRVA